VPADTTYIVLKRLRELDTDDPNPVWAILSAHIDASNAEAAIRKVANGDGTYVAVPARSWKPVQVRTETQTVIRLDTPKEAS
jgi:hypothetical protein